MHKTPTLLDKESEEAGRQPWRKWSREGGREGGLGGVQRREGKNKGIMPSSFTFGLNNEALRVSE